MEKINTRTLTTGWLIGLLALTFCLIPTIGGSTTTQVQADTVMMNTTADVVNTTTQNFPYGTYVTGVKLVPYALNKFYRLRVASISGNILWEHRTTATSDSLSLALDPVKFRIPSTGIYFQTDDAQTTDVRIFLYTAP